MALNKNAKAWVAALRSGKYKQGDSALRPSKNRYCCLGVACDLYMRDQLKVNKHTKWKWDEEGDSFGPKGEAHHLPSIVAKWLGLASETGVFHPNDDPEDIDELVSLNDNGKSFKHIAKVIASEPKGLFKESQ